MSVGALDKVQIQERLTQTLTKVPPGVKIKKMEFGLDADGNTAYIKYFDGSEALVFTLTFSNASAATSSYTITRTDP